MNKPRVRFALCITAAIALFQGPKVFGQNLTITQIDAARLFSAQTVRLSLDFDLGVDEGQVVTDRIRVAESGDGEKYTDLPVRRVSLQANREEGISFFLLLDNSGSMWDDLDGRPTDDPERMRMTHAKKAIAEFAAGLSPLDRAGLAVFNSNYSTLSVISGDTSGIPASLEKVKRPSREEAYTELYGSIVDSLSDFGEIGRRKALIILSDGENFPFDMTKSTAKAEDGIDAAVREGITCYVVNFGPDRDNEIPRIASASGGLVFNARNSDELLNIYTSIRSSILDEYTLTYTASMKSGVRRFVRVSYEGKEATYETVRYYYAGNVLGSVSEAPRSWYLLFILLPLALHLALLFFKLERATTEAGIQLLYGGAGSKTKAFPLDGARTTIGGDATANITIAGNPSLQGNAATIVFDEAKAQYTIVASSDLTVNNKPVKSKKLEPGDVINMAGTVVVFDDAARTAAQKKKKR